MLNEDITELIGHTLKDIEQVGTDELMFTTATGDRYYLYHAGGCCASVDIESIDGDLQSLLGNPILSIREDIDERSERCESSTVTIYTFTTATASVSVRWLGESNGYYCETPAFKKRDASMVYDFSCPSHPGPPCA